MPARGHLASCSAGEDVEVMPTSRCRFVPVGFAATIGDASRRSLVSIYVHASLVVLVAAASGCPAPSDYIECLDDTNCGLAAGGKCTLNPGTGHQFCAYPDMSCPDGMRWSDLDVEDGISGMCVDVPDPDGGVDAGPPMGWTMAASSPRYDFARAVAYDPSGNTYVAGSFYDSALLAGGTFNSNGQSDIFVAKFTPDGQRLWVRTFGGTGADDVYDIKADGARVVIVGKFTNAVDFGTGLLTAQATEGFVAALDPDGVTTWVDHRGGGGATNFRRLDMDANQVVVAADFTGSLMLPSGTVTARGVVDLLALRYTLGGALTWTQVISGTSFDNVGGVALTPDGDALVAGQFMDTLDNGVGTTLTALGAADLFVVKLGGAAGAPMWARRFGGASPDIMMSIDRNDGAIWIAGCFTTATTIGASSFNSAGMEDAFVAALDQSGAVMWAKAIGATESDCATNVVASASSATVAGTFMDMILVEGASLRSLGDKDIWVAEFTNGGVGVSAKRGGGGDTDGSEGLAVRDGWFAVAGNTRGAPDMFGIPLPTLDLFSDGFAVQTQR